VLSREIMEKYCSAWP